MAQRKAHKLEDRERTDDILIEENVDFAGMYLSDQVLQGLKAAGFERPSPIQLAAIPLGRCGLDLVVQAKSGTGKTCVFTVVALEMISVSAITTQVLVIAPTREIAVQITQVVNAIGSGMPGLRASTFIGGIHLAQDKAKLRCCHIAVGTPGRITQLVELGYLKLDNVRLLILDEADQLLTGQFTESVVQLASALPLNKQILALSATYTEDVAKVAERLMRSPNHVRLGRDSPALLGVNQFVRLLPYHHQPYRRQQIKFTELLTILATVTFNQCLVFSNSQLRAESLCNALRASGWPVSYLTGGQKQSDRLKALEELCSYKCRVLVSTDLSARGLDSEHVNLVVNLDMPRDQATYLHRVGRAGRFGSRGGAITLATEGDEWQAMRAIASLANVQVYILQEDWKSSIASKDVEGMEELERLSDEELKIWLEKNFLQIYDKRKDNSCQALEQENTSRKKTSAPREKNGFKMKLEYFEDSGKENREGAVSKKHTHKLKKLQESKDTINRYNGDMNADKKKQNWKMKDSENKSTTDEEVLKRRKREAKRKMENERIQIKAETYKKVLTLLQGLSPKSPSVNASYSDILLDCLEKYDSISVTDNPVVRVPSLPSKLKPTEADIKALDDHWKDTQEEHEQRVIEADETWKCSGADIGKALQDMIEGKDACMLNQVKRGETKSSMTDDHTSVLSSQENQSFSGEESHENHTADNAFKAKQAEVYTKSVDYQEVKHKVQQTTDPCLLTMSSSGDNAVNNQYHKKNVKEKHFSKSNNFGQSTHAKQQDQKGQKPYEYYMNMRSMENPKTKKHLKKRLHSKKQTSFNSPNECYIHQSNNKYNDGRYWGQWDYGTQPMNEYQHQPNYTDHRAWQQNGSTSNIQQQGNYYEYQGTNPIDTQTGWTPQQEEEDYQDLYGGCWDTYYSSAYWNQRSYIKSTYKFASMMDYVQTMGRMSAWMARDFYTRNDESSS